MILLPFMKGYWNYVNEHLRTFAEIAGITWSTYTIRSNEEPVNRDDLKVLLECAEDHLNAYPEAKRLLKEYKEKLRENKVKIYVRRGGPNYKEGLWIMRELGNDLGVPIEVYGPETHMTKIVSMALKGGK
jgi:hypothetical protein